MTRDSEPPVTPSRPLSFPTYQPLTAPPPQNPTVAVLSLNQSWPPNLKSRRIAVIRKNPPDPHRRRKSRLLPKRPQDRPLRRSPSSSKARTPPPSTTSPANTRTPAAPSAPTNSALLDTLIHSDWLLRRMRRVETSALERADRAELRNNNYPRITIPSTPSSNLLVLRRRPLRSASSAASPPSNAPTTAPSPTSPPPGQTPGNPGARSPSRAPAATPEIGFVPSKTAKTIFPPPDTVPGAPISPTLGHFPQLRPLEKPSGAENRHRSPARTTF